MTWGISALAAILHTIRKPGQDMGRCARCSDLRQISAKEGATYLLRKTPVKCGKNVRRQESRGPRIFIRGIDRFAKKSYARYCGYSSTMNMQIDNRTGPFKFLTCGVPVLGAE